MNENMKKNVIPVIVAILLLTAGALPAQEVKGPRIEVKQERFDMGGIVQGKAAVHVFEVRNAGTEPLVIERLQAS